MINQAPIVRYTAFVSEIFFSDFRKKTFSAESYLIFPVIWACRPAARRVRRRVESIYSRRSEEPKAACLRKPTAPLALSSTERLHKKPFACLPTALRPSGPVQQWIFHQAEQELTTLPGLRYSSGHRKGRLKVLILRNGAHVLGNRHHEDAVLLAAVRHDVHRGVALAEGARSGVRLGRCGDRLAALEASRCRPVHELATVQAPSGDIA